MLTIAEYAKSRSVSYEAVRKQINRYSIELDGHISRQGRTQYLDSEAEAFLDSRRQKDPVFVLDDRDRVLQEKEQRIAELEDLLQKMTLKYQAEHAVAMIAEERQVMIADQKEQIHRIEKPCRAEVMPEQKGKRDANQRQNNSGRPKIPKGIFFFHYI